MRRLKSSGRKRNSELRANCCGQSEDQGDLSESAGPVLSVRSFRVLYEGWCEVCGTSHEYAYSCTMPLFFLISHWRAGPWQPLLWHCRASVRGRQGLRSTLHLIRCSCCPHFGAFIADTASIIRNAGAVETLGNISDYFVCKALLCAHMSAHGAFESSFRGLLSPAKCCHTTDIPCPHFSRHTYMQPIHDQNKEHSSAAPSSAIFRFKRHKQAKQ